jgi:transketolase
MAVRHEPNGSTARVDGGRGQNAALRRLSIDTVRGLAMDAVQKADSGHPGTAMALAPLGYLLFTRFLRVNPQAPGWPDRDRFVLSAGHACVLQYSLLHLTGYELSLDDLRQFRQWGSRTPGHPERGHTPGIEITTGPLGQGFANAVGMAMAERFLADRYNRPGHAVVDHNTYAICSDGDLMEGVSQEAASIAGHFALGKLVVCYDDNRITIDGSTVLSFDGENHTDRLAADGWHVQRVSDSEDLDALEAALGAARAETERPSFIAIRSHIAYPAPHAVDTAAAHGSPLGEDEVRAAKRAMGFDPERGFWVDERVYEHMSLIEPGAAAEREWQLRFDDWRETHGELVQDWEQAWSGRLREGWREALPSFPAGESLATRAAGQKTMAAFAEYVPTMIGGAADLVESTKTVFRGGGEFSPVHTGRNVPFGIREHAMGAIVNGAAAHGGIVKPYGSTFLIFSDYMRASVRLSALMGLPVVWVWTHDSVGLGEDGPTHQPIEHYAALRAIPRLWVIRPADANETAEAWRAALEREDGPVALALSRQGAPTLDRASEGLGAAAELQRGGYVLWDSRGASDGHQADDDRDSEGGRHAGESGAQPPLELILIATGTEVAPTLAAARELAGAGHAVRVVSMPCVELFEAQSPEYRDSVLPPAVRARLAVEPGATLGWWKWVGSDGDVLGIDHFGASAPGPRVLQEFGFTAPGILARARALLQRVAASDGRGGADVGSSSESGTRS